MNPNRKCHHYCIHDRNSQKAKNSSIILYFRWVCERAMRVRACDIHFSFAFWENASKPNDNHKQQHQQRQQQRIIYHTNTQKIFCVDSTASLKWNAINNCRIPERHREKIGLKYELFTIVRTTTSTTTVLQLEIMRVSETHAKILISFYLFIKWANKISSLWVLCFNCR